MKHKIWISRIVAAVLAAAVAVCLFWKPVFALLLVLLWAVYLCGVGFLLDLSAFDTKRKWTIPSVIDLNDRRALTDEDRERMEWIQKTGMPLKAHLQDGTDREALFLHHPSPKGILFVLHGYGDYSWQSVQIPVRRFYEMGYSVLMPRQRGFGRNNGRYTTMGVLEREDHLYWLERLRGHFPEQDIFLYGISMGAACAMNLCDIESNGQIRGIIEDCGYVSLPDQLKGSMTFLMGVDSFPLYGIARRMARLVPGFDLRKFDVTSKLKNSRYPLLAIHGKKDDFVPFYNLERIRQAAGSHLAGSLAVPDAAHCQSYRKAENEYFDLIQNFLETYASNRDPANGEGAEKSADRQDENHV